MTGITFVIPTVDRPTLPGTLESLKKNKNPNWNAIVVFDGIEPTYRSDDDRITIIKTEKVGKLNHGGRVRNEGIKQSKTEWIGFVDDDDILKHTYVDLFNEELNNNTGADVIIFRMIFTNGLILPPPRNKTFVKNQVGISFCLKRSLFVDENFWFEPSSTEDYDLLDRLRTAGKKIVMSDHVTYFVRP
jgi:glycosyltransferase involved in cell wall biosynthesis